MTNAGRSDQVAVRVLGVLASIGCLFASGPAPAGYFYSLSGIGPGEVVPVGTIRTIDVYLDYDGQGPANVLPGGVFSAWTGLRYTSGTTGSLEIVDPPPEGGPPSPLSGITANPDFNASITRGPLPGNTAFSELPGFTRLHALLASSNLPPNYATSTSANNSGGSPTSLYLGSFDIRTANSAAVEAPITLQAHLYDFASGTNITTSTFSVLDPVTQPGSIAFTVAAAPEPGTTTMAGFACGALLHLKRRAVRRAKRDEAHAATAQAGVTVSVARQRYHDATERHGRQRSAIASRSRGFGRSGSS
jgi:hypothetical protein